MDTASDCVRVNILTFATVRDRLESAGCRSNTDELNKFRIALAPTWPSGQALRRHLCGQLWPVLADIEHSIALALNLQYIDLHDGPLTLTTDDNLALIPPISGG